MTGLISINKPHTDNIFSGAKSLEWRKKPLPEGLYYVYETKNKGGCGKVVGEMRITGTKAVDTSGHLEVCLVNAGCVHPSALKKYANNGTLYANFIESVKKYEKPKPLGIFNSACDKKSMMDCTLCIKLRLKKCNPVVRPPQSWCYVEELEDGE